MALNIRNKVRGGSEHFAHFYQSDVSISNLVSKYIVEGLNANETCIVAATPEHLRVIEPGIAASYPELEDRRRSGSYITVDPADMLSNVLVDGLPDRKKFFEVCGEFVKTAMERGNGVRMFGEGTAVLWAAGKYEAAIRLEELWNELTDQHLFSLFCAFPMNVFVNLPTSLNAIHACGDPSHAEPQEKAGRFASADERLREVFRVHHVAPQSL